MDEKLWAGLNSPSRGLNEVDLALFGIPFDGSVSFRGGAREAPDALRKITYTISPTTEDFEDFSSVKLLDLGNVDTSSREHAFREAEEVTKQIMATCKRFIMIGGDHSVTIPVHKGIDASLDHEFGIVHIDAHFDLCDDQGGDRFSHGSTERRALELKNVTGLDSIFFLGVRSIESAELDFFRSNQVNVLSAKKISEIGARSAAETVVNKFKIFRSVYITLDIDCLDPGYAGGTGTPQFGGLDPRGLLTMLDVLFRLNVIGMDIVEVAPTLDDSLASLFAARKIVTECIGHWNRKGWR